MDNYCNSAAFSYSERVKPHPFSSSNIDYEASYHTPPTFKELTLEAKKHTMDFNEA